MKLYAISDLHLSFDANKPMDIFPGWENYTDRLKENWIKTVKNEDTVVIPGDLSWGLKIEETLSDFKYLDNLPGTKVFIKGNHDLWWSTATKLKDFLQNNNIDSVKIVYNNCYKFGNYAVCGTRGWFFEEKQTDKKIILREAGRLETSIKSALDNNLSPIVFLHYPPVWGDYINAEIMDILKKYRIKRVFHGHIHGANYQKEIKNAEGIEFVLVSADRLKFVPYCVSDLL